MAESKYLKKTQGNGASTTLSASITNADTSAPLTSDTAFDGEGMLLIDEGQATEEFAYGTGKVGSSITILADDRGLEGGSAQAHSDTATVKGIITSGMWNNMVEAVSKTVSATDGTLLKATGAEINTGTEDAKIVTPKAIADSYLVNGYNSLYRQAIINGNFDVWQRGTSVALADATITYEADRWFDYAADDGGTIPTLTRTRQALTAGELAGSYYFARLTTNGAGTSLGDNSYGAYRHRIEHGTRLLCGLNKTVTVSFYARSDIANKRICPALMQNYGSGGSPSTLEYIKGTPITLTSTLTKYTATFTTNTLTGKTFGTANDDYLELTIFYQWGVTIGDARVQTGVTAETYVGAGNIDIAQVQLCAGDVALPFMPKSYEDELRACQRYCYGITTSSVVAFGPAYNTTVAYPVIYFPVEMRTTPTSTATYSDWKLTDVAAGAINLSAIASDDLSFNSTRLGVIKCTVASGLTAFKGYYLLPTAANKTIYFSAEL